MDDRDADHDIVCLAQRIQDVDLDAVASLAAARIEETAQQWLAKKPLDPNDPTSPLRVMEAFALASFLTLFSSSLLGVSPLERFIRQRRADADDLWGETARDSTLRFVFFGLPADVEAAHYLHDLIVATFETETTRFKRAALADAGDGRRVSAHSFQIGLAHGICEKLTGLKAERDAANRRATGRDLVPLKTSVIEEELEKLGLSFRAKSQNRKRKVAPDAYNAGRAAGRKFEPHRSVSET
ncbi:hypothetical protein CCR94_07295 [Rhodoblastus sphagnicola]|uniref:DUF7168 domain-containing protein n=1 Tax=Rhodoblastus sphagnicola TaxID=333368 RepID=A0A2S6NBL3_9HYPH|nr:hypothetical protein [Rhodoblastus sphagnicola]MBB4199660.1 hypothetical protein [Rhodoblastus sphagnicola]PPQ32005.1 hypothetical protein CCR94_07295 [Rhodoblastus sphagnicola]